MAITAKYLHDTEASVEEQKPAIAMEDKVLLDIDDESLLSALQKGDEQAFGVLSKRYYALIYRVAWRVLRDNAQAEDIVQDAMLKLWTRPEDIRSGQSLKGWLIRVAHNRAIDHLRVKRPDLPGELPETHDGEQPEGILQRKQAAGSIDEAIATLPDRQQMAISLSYFEGFSNRETAQIMDTSTDAVESMLARARRNLKQMLSNDWQALLAQLQQ